MSISYDRSFKMKINEDKWTFVLITEEEAVEVDQAENESDDGFAAAIVTEKKMFYLVEGHVTKGAIAHELLHLFIYYFRLDSTNISLNDFEEIIAEWIEADIDKFIKIRNKLYNKFKKLEGST